MASFSLSQLSMAGFYHIPTNNEPDAVRCFCCYKELDGWEPDDDPWFVHVSPNALIQSGIVLE